MSFIKGSHASQLARQAVAGLADLQQIAGIAALLPRARRMALVIALAGGFAFAGAGLAGRAEAELPRVQINETYVQDVLRQGDLDVKDPLAVFGFVLSSLAPEVRVYPTENYYYFRFVLNGLPYAGSFRLGPKDREAQKIEFGYYKDLAEWADELDDNWHAVFGAKEGVSVEKLEALRFRVTYKGTSVVFALNDLSGVKMPPQMLAPGDRYIGPIFDESGVRFFLVYGSRQKVFHYLLDETVPLADAFVPMKGSDRLLIGRRTGFAFYRDHLAERKILVGVYDGNSRLNTYFDGPFDQLPENFIEGETLRQAIIDADPGAKGEIDRLGNFEGDEGRYSIHPYMLYKQPKDLLRIHACAMQAVKRADAYYRCFFTAPPPLPPEPAQPKPARPPRK